MTLKQHAAYGAAASAALFPIYKFNVLFFFATSVLIDIDHYIDYLYYSKFLDWSPRRMFAFHGALQRINKHTKTMALEAFHTGEFLLAFLAVGLYYRSTPLLLAFAGFIFHLILDLVRLNQINGIDLRALTFVEYIIRKKKMIRETGKSPEAMFFEAYNQVR